MPRTVNPTGFGGPEVLELFETATPAPRRDEVLVEVRATGVNPIDWKLYSGSFHKIDPRNRTAPAAAVPAVGWECAGIVTAVGEEVTGVEVGAEVIVYPVIGAYADYVTVPAGSLTPKPAGLGWAEAGGLMLAGTTAVHALAAADVGPEDTVLVHGASGGVGLMAVQLARALGAVVIGTASPPRHDLLRSLGAVPVAYGPGLLDRVRASSDAPVTAALDLVGTDEALDVSLALVKDPQRIASITGTDRRRQAGVKLLGNGPGQDAGTELRAAARESLAGRAGSGELTVFVDGTFPLDRVADAHRTGIEGHGPGKLVVLP